jgi:hypothetical protein
LISVTSLNINGLAATFDRNHWRKYFSILLSPAAPSLPRRLLAALDFSQEEISMSLR